MRPLLPGDRRSGSLVTWRKTGGGVGVNLCHLSSWFPYQDTYNIVYTHNIAFFHSVIRGARRDEECGLVIEPNCGTSVPSKNDRERCCY